VKCGVIIVVIILLSYSLSGQCPDRDFLWRRIIYLRDSSRVPSEEQKAELLRYLDKVKSCPYKNDSTHALLLQRLGWLYSTQKDFIKAVQCSRQSLDIIYKNRDRPSVNYGHVVKTYNNLRIFYDSIGDYKLKQQAIDSCISIGLKLNKGDPHGLLLMKTFNLLQSGDYYKCIEMANIGEQISRTNLNYSYLPYYLIWKIDALILVKKFGEAEEVLTKAVNDCIKSGDKDFIGSYYSLLARVSEEKKDEKSSLMYVSKSVSSNKKAKKLNVCAQALNNAGYFLYFKQLKNYEKALQYYYKALKYADASEALNVYENIANIYVERKLFDSAFYFFQKGFDQIKPGIDESGVLRDAEKYVINNQIDYLEYIANLLLDNADAFLAYYKFNRDGKNLDKAIASYRIIDRLFDKIKASHSEIGSKLFWRSHIHRLYENSIAACYLQGNKDDAFYFFEKSRAVLLNDQLNEQRWLGEQDIFKQAQLKKQILAKGRQLDTMDKSLTAYGDLEREMFANKQELTRLQQQIKESNPLYYQSFLDSNSITIASLRQNVLKDHEALIEILSGDSAVYVLAVTTQKSFLQKIDKNDFDNLSLPYISYLSDRATLNKGFEAFKNISSQLYRLIFKNISLPAGRVIISLDNRYFPFEALVTSLQPLTFFLEEHAVSYTYSARYLMNDFTSNPGFRATTFLGVAPIRFASNTHLATLVGSDQSLARIQQYFQNATNLTGVNATRNNFLSDFYKYRIIQLYTHATDSGYTGEPLIYFFDSVLMLSDLIYQKRPVTSLIVLSACETGSGKLYNGEGVFSFNRQFAALGIPSSIANLWPADNESSYRVTELFYKYLRKGLPPDVALQRAKKEFLKTTLSKENKLPYYWAASILVGQTNTIPFQKSSKWTWTMAVLGALVLLVGWACIIKRNVR
jgi:CHAT domain-containing protein